MVRQGDILLVPIEESEIPTDAAAVPSEHGRLILARGEATGHHHSVAEAESTALLATPNAELWLLIKEGDALLEHQEHAAIPLRGAYKVVQQREYSPTALRRVAD